MIKDSKAYAKAQGWKHKLRGTPHDCDRAGCTISIDGEEIVREAPKVSE